MERQIDRLNHVFKQLIRANPISDELETKYTIAIPAHQKIIKWNPNKLR
jgi:hypothetical protein